MRQIAVCDVCGSTDIRFECTASWSVEKDRPDPDDLSYDIDKCLCRNCGGGDDFVERGVDYIDENDGNFFRLGISLATAVLALTVFQLCCIGGLGITAVTPHVH